MAIPNTSNPTQIGFIPYNTEDPNTQRSSVIIGRDTTTDWEAIGYGSGARPDVLQYMAINLSYPRDVVNPISADNPLASNTYIQLDVTDIKAAKLANPENFPTTLTLIMKEIAVCEIDDETGEAVEKRMVGIFSQTYLPSGSA